MKKILLALTINLVFLNLSKAQIPKEAFTLTNSLSGLWQNGDTKKAIESSLELYQLYPPFLVNNIHNNLAQQLQNDPKQFGHKYLEQLFLKKNKEINKIISPIYLWSRSIVATADNDLKKISEELNSILADSANYKSKTELYCLLVLQELDKKNAIDAKTKEIVLQKNINNLEKYPYINSFYPGRPEGEKRAWHRYLLAYSYNYLCTLQSNGDEYLKKASDYSPDQIDRLYKNAYFYDAAVLTGNTREFGFQPKYLNYLIENNRNSEALILLSNISIGSPTDNNMKSLRDYYKKINSNEPFNDYWNNYVNKISKPVPKIKIQFEKEELDLTKKRNNWIYIDVWGTWCNPCLKELPSLQSYFVENKSNLKIYTFSYGSQNLKDFMDKNRYTFPVSEIDKVTNDLFGISEYPTKILISPDGNFIKIPFGEDWKMYIKNYALISSL